MSCLVDLFLRSLGEDADPDVPSEDCGAYLLWWYVGSSALHALSLSHRSYSHVGWVTCPDATGALQLCGDRFPLFSVKMLLHPQEAFRDWTFPEHDWGLDDNYREAENTLARLYSSNKYCLSCREQRADRQWLIQLCCAHAASCRCYDCDTAHLYDYFL
jgi:hypothetical protein